jgi:predicted TIM-barrel fold metal-dependent hydrolase
VQAVPGRVAKNAPVEDGMEMKRRALLTAAAVLAVGVGAGKARRLRAQALDAAPSPTKPRPMPAPSLASDCHIHVYDSRFPVAANAMLLPPDAHVDDYRVVQRRIGTTRTVVVQPSTYGTDNRCMLNALASLGAEARGVAMVDVGVSDAELERLAAAGVRGIRFNFMQPSASITVDMLEPLAQRIAALGWHVQLNIRSDHIVQLEPLLSRLASPIVFDHFARIPPEAGAEHPAYAVVQRLIDRDRGWVKLSGAYLESKVGPPSYADVGALARAFMKTAPQRLVWGSDWPHPSVHAAWPDEAVLLEALCAWAPDEAVRRQILVANPEALYGFPKDA